MVVAALLPPWLLRAALVVGSGMRPGAADLRGLLADVGIGLLVAALLIAACCGRWSALLLIAL